MNPQSRLPAWTADTATPLDAATRYSRAGWSCIPVPHRSKRPTMPEWQTRRLIEPDLPDYFNGRPMNIGVLLGEPSRGLIDVDLDCPEAVALAPVILGPAAPTSCTFGRKSKQRSHWLYVCNPPPATAKFIAPDGTMLVELRGGGCQTIVPPSTHESGEAVLFDPGAGPPAEVVGTYLAAVVAKLAAVSLLARQWPNEGARHNAAMALAGGLTRAGWAAEDVAGFVEVVAKAGGDDDVDDRVQAAADTFTTIGAGGKATGWPALAEIISKEAVSKVRAWLGIGKEPPETVPAAPVPAALAPAYPLLRRFSEIEAQEVSWLWQGKLARGKLTALVSPPGLGKTLVTCDLASRVSTGSPMPDGTPGARGSVIMVNAEDDPGDTLRPRLDAAGADVSRMMFLSGVGRRGEDGKTVERAFTLHDEPALRLALEQNPDTALVIIDPIGSFMGKTDTHRDNEVRASLAPLVRVAAEFGAAVLLVMHRRKGLSKSADETVLGSTAFTGVRQVWHIRRDPDNRLRREMLPGKSNVAAEAAGLGFTIHGEGSRPAVAWEREPIRKSADEAFADEAGDNGGQPDRDAAADFLRHALAAGPLHAPDVFRLAKRDGIGDRTLRGAARGLGVKMVREGFGPGSKVMWSLPDDIRRECPEKCADEKYATYGRGLGATTAYGTGASHTSQDTGSEKYVPDTRVPPEVEALFASDERPAIAEAR